MVRTKEPTARQKEILDFIKKEISTKGYPPSVREIGARIGLTSSSTVHNHLTALEHKGYIKRDPTKPRALEILDGWSIPRRDKSDVISLPLLGTTAAGSPLLAVEDASEEIQLPKELGGSEACFVLTVRGDSMIMDGILSGDMVVVRPQKTAENGDIVVAMLNDEATVKRFYKEDGFFRLQPANDKYDPIITDTLEIVGKVISLFRRL